MVCNKHLDYRLSPLLLILILILSACAYNTKEFPAVEFPTDLKAPTSMKTNPEPVKTYSKTKAPALNSENKITKKCQRRPGLTFYHNNKINHWIKRYTGQDRSWFEANLYDFDTVRPRMEKIFDKYGIPTELVYLSLVESEGKPNAVSRAGATGYWQFIRPTAIKYGLKVNKWVDERRNLDKSTTAAALYLRHLHSMFHDWPLSCAAYNAGEGRIQRLLKRYPYIKSFWDISPNMPIREETLVYVPKFMAALTISKNRSLYGFNKVKPSLPKQYELVKVHTFTRLDKIAKVIDRPTSVIASLNPELIRKCTPPGQKEYVIKIPRETKGLATAYLDKAHNKNITFITYVTKKGDTLYGISRRYNSTIKHIAMANRIRPKDVLPVGKEIVVPMNSKTRTKYNKHSYVVRKGDTVERISQMFGVSIVDIIKANHLNPRLLLPGKTINIPSILACFRPDHRSISYRIRQGDTIWGISRHFDVSATDIIRWNMISSPATIYPGDTITIYIEQS